MVGVGWNGGGGVHILCVEVVLMMCSSCLAWWGWGGMVGVGNGCPFCV